VNGKTIPTPVFKRPKNYCGAKEVATVKKKRLGASDMGKEGTSRKKEKKGCTVGEWDCNYRPSFIKK